MNRLNIPTDDGQTIYDGILLTHNFCSNQFRKSNHICAAISPYWSGLGHWLLVSLLLAPSSNIKPTRESHICSPNLLQKTPHFSLAHLASLCQQLLIKAYWDHRSFPSWGSSILLLVFESLPRTHDDGWLPCYSKRWVNSLYLSLSGWIFSHLTTMKRGEGRPG